MAPEQLEGQEADSRADIFAFGAVLYEMVTGQRAFNGQSTASVIAAILEHHPAPMSAAQPLTPRSLDRLVAACLAKAPDDRWQSARDLVRELRWVAEAGLQPEAPGVSANPPQWRPRATWALLGLILGAGISGAGVALSRLASPGALAEDAAVRFFVSAPDNAQFGRLLIDPWPAVSPDGRQLAFVAHTGDQGPDLYVRALDALGAQRLPDTSGAQSPFWSPDSRFVGFFNEGKLKRIDIQGGPPVTISDASPAGGTWSSDGTILFATRDGLYVQCNRDS